MKKEHIIRFKLIRKEGVKLLRGVIFLEENQTPSLLDFEQCLKDCGHDVRLENKEQAIFRAYKPGEEYEIDILEDYQDASRDSHAEQLAKTFLKDNSPL
ncbi:hypothetical protein GK047_27875 [Paenibacillus sp. SYP-B3998]|uniref:Uncharacterized protein n=1 Tax=Paenibacillus sp. SYP-B3998 TaxID=2678564 RepID=A0A6G4A723_9BACL|nr:hypothetical protein [Paenibacillus sp. SYP-B3998]NEW09744.1 hypothetical protein [Paenibacillus sp. SYP-B3998]